MSPSDKHFSYCCRVVAIVKTIVARPALIIPIIFVEDEPQILGTCNGSYKSRQLFSCHPNHGKFIPVSELIKEEDFFTLLAGMHVLSYRLFRRISLYVTDNAIEKLYV